MRPTLLCLVRSMYISRTSLGLALALMHFCHRWSSGLTGTPFTCSGLGCWAWLRNRLVQDQLCYTGSQQLRLPAGMQWA